MDIINREYSQTMHGVRAWRLNSVNPNQNGANISNKRKKKLCTWHDIYGEAQKRLSARKYGMPQMWWRNRMGNSGCLNVSK